MIEQDMTSEDVLLAAADIIQQRGLTKHTLGHNDGPVCSIGAINEAISGFPDERGIPEVALPCIKRLYDHLLVKDEVRPTSTEFFYSSRIVGWNNQNTTTADDVVLAFHDAARGIK